MPLRTPVFIIMLMILLNMPLHEGGTKRDPWIELEKGLKLCGVENISYQTGCFIGESDAGRILNCSGIGVPGDALREPAECLWAMQSGYENEEILLHVRGSDRQACSALWRRLESAVGRGKAHSTRVWSVEAFLSEAGDLKDLGEALVRALGGGLQGIYVNSRMVQLLAYLPWAGEGIILDEGPVNLHVELYNFASTDLVRIRLGIPVLHSPPF